MKPFQLIYMNTRRYKGALAIAACAMLALVGVQLLIPWVLKTLLEAITASKASLGDMGKIAQLTLLVLGVFLARAGLEFLRSYMSHLAGWGVVADTRNFIYAHMQRLSLRFYQDKQVGQLMSNLVNDTELFEQLIAHAVP